jgi:hypothetical protein
MPSFLDVLTDAQAQAIHAYLISRAQEDWQPAFLPPPKRR